jgi:hypothetical protein
MTVKNPYELRYDIYQQAQGRLTEKFYLDHQVWSDFEDFKRNTEADGHEVTCCGAVKNRPSFPTHEDILVEAEKIYSFVQQSK